MLTLCNAKVHVARYDSAARGLPPQLKPSPTDSFQEREQGEKFSRGEEPSGWKVGVQDAELLSYYLGMGICRRGRQALAPYLGEAGSGSWVSEAS